MEGRHPSSFFDRITHIHSPLYLCQLAWRADRTKPTSPDRAERRGSILPARCRDPSSARYNHTYVSNILHQQHPKFNIIIEIYVKNVTIALQQRTNCPKKPERLFTYFSLFFPWGMVYYIYNGVLWGTLPFSPAIFCKKGRIIWVFLRLFSEIIPQKN